MPNQETINAPVIFITIIALLFLYVLIRITICILGEKYIRENINTIKSNARLYEKIEAEYKTLCENMNKYYDINSNLGLDETVRCSNSVVSNAYYNPIKYIQKYSKISDTREDLEKLDFIKALINTSHTLLDDLNNAYLDCKEKIPLIYRLNMSRNTILRAVCGIKQSAVSIREPYLLFLYISPAGKSRRSYKISINADIIEQLQSNICGKINKKGHAKTQRGAMTNDLREAIKKRDNYTCQICGNSVFKEPNLLLEVDHIIPVSRGGETKAENLQTLCWRCNRNKGNKQE